MLGNIGARGKQEHGRKLRADFYGFLLALDFRLQCYCLRCFTFAQIQSRLTNDGRPRDDIGVVSYPRTQNLKFAFSLLQSRFEAPICSTLCTIIFALFVPSPIPHNWETYVR